MLTAWKLLGARLGTVGIENNINMSTIFDYYIHTVPVWSVVKFITSVLVFPTELLACIM